MDLHCQKAVLGDTANVGINYGMVADNLPPPTEVVELLKSISISKVKIYSTNRKVLRAFRNTGISFTVGIGNEDVASLISLESAMRWLHDNVLLYLPDTQISAIAVGNEAFSGNDTILMSNVLKAMQNIYVCLSNLGLSGKIHVSTPHSLAVLQNSYPPSAGSFLPELVQPFMKPLLSLLSISGSPFMINAYPFFAYKASPSTVNLEYALFLNREGMQDRSTGLLYYGMLDAQVDAIYSAMAGLGFNNVKVIVSETGWPSRGDADEAGANLKNAQIYNSNLIRRVASMKGTPLKPNVSLEAYVFALFNENMKPGPASERHYGLFMPDGMKSYDFGLDNPMSSTLYAANDVSASSNSLARYAAFWITPALYLLSSLSGNLIAASAF
ncbi:hypothetical protein KP509_13G097600 [Ceratopteris richardii]|nr:hypothetical protein KP509_13G097600 [Ceratopteris richardii]